MDCSSGQLGAEGFIVGGGYVIFSLAVALFTHGVPSVKNGFTRGGVSFMLLALAAFVAQKVWQVSACTMVVRVSLLAAASTIGSADSAPLCLHDSYTQVYTDKTGYFISSFLVRSGEE